jgi:membrane fusion protein (multidrug efflux system)
MDSLLASGAVSAQQRDAATATDLSAQANLEAAQADVEAAQAGLVEAQQRERQTAVAVRQAIRRAQAARAQVSQAEAAIRQAQAGLRGAESSPAQTGVRRSEARTALGRVTEAKARLAQAALNLSYTRLVAPVTGVVAKKNVEPGQFVQPGQSLLAIVAAGSDHVTANFKETQLGRVQRGQRATFTVDAYPGLTFYGRVESISPGTGAVFSLLPPENASGNFTKVVQRIPVRIAIDRSRSPRRVLRAGMSVVATVETR